MVEGEGPLVLLLHGFPETSHAWRKQIPALANRFRVVAPDLRGYGRSEKPRGIDAYRAPVLTGDIAALIHEFGAERAHVVGHDWGGGVAWSLAILRPEVVNRLAVLNCPHPAIMQRALRSNWTQIRKSWYIFAFQLPWLPEWALSRSGARALKDSLRRSGKPGLQRRRPRRVRARVRRAWSRDRRAELLPRRAAVTFAGDEDQGADASHLGRR